MHTRTSERTIVNKPTTIHFYGDQVDISESEDVSTGGFFVRTDTVRNIQIGVVALVTIELSGSCSTQYLAEVVRVTDRGAAFQIID